MSSRMWATWEFLVALVGVTARAVVVALAVMMALVLPALTILSWF